MAFRFDFAEFGPRRAEEIAGVSRVTQRDWRREGHLAAVAGQASYNLFDLCELWILKASADVGLGPKRAKVFSRAASLHMGWHCLRLIDTYDGDHLNGPKSPHEKSPLWASKSRWLADHILLGKDEKIPCSEFYVIWPDGTSGPKDHFETLSISAQFEPRKRGAVIVLPLYLAAFWLVAAAGEPMVRVTFGTSSSSSIKRVSQDP
jgi:hypothetical protein